MLTCANVLFTDSKDRIVYSCFLQCSVYRNWHAWVMWGAAKLISKTLRWSALSSRRYTFLLGLSAGVVHHLRRRFSRKRTSLPWFWKSMTSLWRTHQAHICGNTTLHSHPTGCGTRRCCYLLKLTAVSLLLAPRLSMTTHISSPQSVIIVDCHDMSSGMHVTIIQ